MGKYSITKVELFFSEEEMKEILSNNGYDIIRLDYQIEDLLLDYPMEYILLAVPKGEKPKYDLKEYDGYSRGMIPDHIENVFIEYVRNKLKKLLS